MSMHISIHGVPDNDRVNKAKAKEARDIMNSLGIEYPEELDNIIESEIEVPVTKVNSQYADDYAINVKDIPENVSTIVFSVNY